MPELARHVVSKIAVADDDRRWNVSTSNRGGVAVMCAQRVDLDRAGHIMLVVPKTDSHQAVRQGGAVVRPFQSQAGAHNFRYGMSTRSWWTGNQSRAFGFWEHA